MDEHSTDSLKIAVEWKSAGRRFELQLEPETATLVLPDGELLEMSIDDWRLLAKALERARICMSVVSKKKALSQNAGQAWTAELDQQLVDLWRAGVELKQLAQEFGRTTGAINSRLLKLVPLYKSAEGQGDGTNSNSPLNSH